MNNAFFMTYNNLQMMRWIIDRNRCKNCLPPILKPVGKHEIHRVKHVKRVTDLYRISAEMRQIADSQVASAFACDFVYIKFQEKYRRRQDTNPADFSRDTLTG